MGIVVVIEFPDAALDDYQRVMDAAGEGMTNQPKRLQHVCYALGARGFVVVDVWEDDAAFAAFGDVIGPALAKVGLEGNPKVYPLHGRMGPDGVRNP